VRPRTKDSQLPTMSFFLLCFCALPVHTLPFSNDPRIHSKVSPHPVAFSFDGIIPSVFQGILTFLSHNPPFKKLHGPPLPPLPPAITSPSRANLPNFSQTPKARFWFLKPSQVYLQGGFNDSDTLHQPSISDYSVCLLPDQRPPCFKSSAPLLYPSHRPRDRMLLSFFQFGLFLSLYFPLSLRSTFPLHFFAVTPDAYRLLSPRQRALLFLLETISRLTSFLLILEGLFPLPRSPLLAFWMSTASSLLSFYRTGPPLLFLTPFPDLDEIPLNTRRPVSFSAFSIIVHVPPPQIVFSPERWITISYFLLPPQG